MDFYFSSLITSHSVFVTHQSSLKIPHHSTQSVFGTIIQLIITQNFQLFVGPIPVTWYSFYFYFLFFPSTPSTQIHWTQWKKKKEKEKKEKELSEYQKYYVMKNQKKKKKKRKNDLKNNGEERKKKKRVKSCSWPWLVGPSVCLIIKMLLEKKLWNLKIPKSCYWKTWNTDKCWE